MMFDRPAMLGELALAGLPVPSFRRLTSGTRPLWQYETLIRPVAHLLAGQPPPRGGLVRVTDRLAWGRACILAGGGSGAGLMAERWMPGDHFRVLASVDEGGRIQRMRVAALNLERLPEFSPFVITDGYDAPAPLERRELALLHHWAGLVAATFAEKRNGWPLLRLEVVLQRVTGRPPVVTILSAWWLALASGEDEPLASLEPEAHVSVRYVWPRAEDAGQLIRKIERGRLPMGGVFFAREGDRIAPVTNRRAALGRVHVGGRLPAAHYRLLAAQLTAELYSRIRISEEN